MQNSALTYLLTYLLTCLLAYVLTCLLTHLLTGLYDGKHSVPVGDELMTPPYLIESRRDERREKTASRVLSPPPRQEHPFACGRQGVSSSCMATSAARVLSYQRSRVSSRNLLILIFFYQSSQARAGLRRQTPRPLGGISTDNPAQSKLEKQRNPSAEPPPPGHSEAVVLRFEGVEAISDLVP